MRRAGLCTVLLAAMLLPALALAADPPPDATRRRVAVLPVMNFALNTADTVWTEADASKKDTVAASLQRFLVKRLAVEPHLVVVPPGDVVTRIKAVRVHREGAQLGLERMSLGQALYKDLRVADAIPHLEHASAALSDSFYGFVDAQTMSELALLLGLCQMEAKRPHQTHIALKEMFHWAPNRRFKRGFYSKAFEQAIISALTDFNVTYPKENPFGTAAKRDRFARDLDVDAIVYAYLIPGRDGRAQVHIAVYDRHTRSTAYRSDFIATSVVKDLERVDRFVSRWATCLPTVVAERMPRKPQPESVHTFFLDTNFVYTVFGSHASDQSPTRDPFHNFGMTVTAEWQFLSGLGAFVLGGMLISSADPTRDLQEDVTTIRTAAGMSYAFSGARWWRIYARFGLEGQFLSSFETATHRWCKWGTPEKCPSSGNQQFAASRMLGFHAAMGFQLITPRALYWNFRVGMSAYIVSTEDAPELNFPASFETGIGYKF